MTTDRDTVRERLKIATETQLADRARFEQRVEDLEAALKAVSHQICCVVYCSNVSKWSLIPLLSNSLQSILLPLTMNFRVLMCGFQCERERNSAEEHSLSLQRLSDQLELQLKEQDVLLAQSRDDTTQEKANNQHIRSVRYSSQLIQCQNSGLMHVRQSVTNVDSRG